MARIKKTYDVFLSYSLDLAGQAEVVTGKFAEAGLTVFNLLEVKSGMSIVRETWQALAESWALVALIKGGTVPPSVAIEIGAAAAWQKPVYVVIEGKGKYDVPSHFSEYDVFKASEIGKVIELVLSGLTPLTDKQMETLKNVYIKLGIPTDKLLMEPASIDRLNKMVSKQSGVRLSGERIMQELLRLRKGGKLPRVRKKK